MFQSGLLGLKRNRDDLDGPKSEVLVSGNKWILLLSLVELRALNLEHGGHMMDVATNEK